MTELLVPPGFQVRLAGAEPDAFDPLTAPETQLRMYGYPLRPKVAGGAKGASEVLERWERLCRQLRSKTYVEPTLRLDEGKERPQLPAAEPEGDQWWSGGVVKAGPGCHFVDVGAEWTLPLVYPRRWVDTGLDVGSEFHSSVEQWIGIAGFGHSDILQAGTSISIRLFSDGGSEFKLFFWYKWSPGRLVEVHRLDVNFGDHVVCGLQVYEPMTATVYMANVTTGMKTALDITAISTAYHWPSPACRRDRLLTRPMLVLNRRQSLASTSRTTLQKAARLPST